MTLPTTPDKIKEFFKKARQQRLKKLKAQTLQKKLSDEITKNSTQEEKENFFKKLEIQKLNEIKNQQKKILQKEINLKKQKEVLTKQKEIRDENKKNFKLSVGKIGEWDSKNIIKKKLSDNQKVQDLLANYKKELKDKLFNSELDLTPSCVHLEIFAYVANDGNLYSTCKKCSRLKKWNKLDWERAIKSQFA